MARNRISFAGTIDSVLWRDKNSNRALVRLRNFKDSNNELGDSAVVSGILGDLKPGMYIRGKGSIKRSNQNEKELKAWACTAHLPRKPADILSYLPASGLPFIGSTNAAIEFMFAANGGQPPRGESTLLKQLVDDPGQIRVKGFPRQVVQMASEALKKEAQRVTSVNQLVLHAGLNRDRAIALAEKIEDPMAYLASNPYQTAILFDVDFKTCDAIAQALNYGKEYEPEKMFAAVSTVFKQHQGHGSMALEMETLRAGLAACFDSQRDVEHAIEILRYTPLFLNTKIGDREIIQNQRHHELEATIARELNRLATADSALNSKDWEITAPEHQSADASDQRKGILMALESNVSILTGGPGTGKTTTVKTILNMLDNAGRSDGQPVRFSLSAPSGLASKRMMDSTGRDALTIHKTLKMTHAAIPAHNKDNPIEADVVVIDEGSMLDAEIFCKALQAVPTGAKVLLVGDPDQLPSVGAGNVLEDLIRADNSLIPSTKLAKVFRNAGPIAHNAHAINAGKMPEVAGSPSRTQGANDPWNVWYLKSDAEKKDMVRWLVSTEIPQNYGHDPYDIQVLSPQHGGPLGTESLNRMLQECINPMGPGKTELKMGSAGKYRTGDKIIYLANTPEKRLVNGDIGFVQSIDSRKREMVVRFGEQDVTLSGKGLLQTKLAYCLTIHKSQGSEYPAAIIPMSESHRWTRQLYYTGVTRGKGHVFTLTDPKTLETAVNDSKRVLRITGLAEAVNIECKAGSKYEVESGFGHRVLKEKALEPDRTYAPSPT